MKEALLARRVGDSLVIEGAELQAGSLWRAQRLSDTKMLVSAFAQEDRESYENHESGFLGCSYFKIDLFAHMLEGLRVSGWSGVVSVFLNQGVRKKLFFSHGKLAFAESNLVDDRLGEVIYRQNQINLEELIRAAGKVSPELKFGQVLLDASILDSVGLWEALNLQIIRIVNSIFMQESLYVEIHPLQHLNFQILIKNKTQDILDTSYSYGYALRYFKGLMNSDDVLVVDSNLSASYGEGTFLGDFLSLILKSQNVGSLIKNSSLQESYTFDVLILLLRMGVCSLKNKLFPPPSNEFNATLKTKVLGYTRLLETVESLFKKEGKILPLKDLLQMVKGVDNEALPVFFLDPKARLRKTAETFLMAQAMVSKERASYFESCFDYLIKFIVVLAQDRLPKKRVEEACLPYKELVL